MYHLSRIITRGIFSLSILILVFSQPVLQAQDLTSDGAEQLSIMEIETITPQQASTFKANYENYIAGLESTNANALTIDLTEELLDAIKRQKRITNSEPGQTGVKIIFGLREPDGESSQRVYYQMVYPTDADGKILPFTKGKVFVVRIPVASNLRNILNCPPYCD